MHKPGLVTIGIASAKVFQVQLFQNGAPFDLTNLTQLVVSFPKLDGGFVAESYPSNVSIVGASGAGRIQITCPAVDTEQMNPNPVPELFQDLQMIATINGVVQIDSLTIPSPAAILYSVTLNGQVFSYQAMVGDTDMVILTKIMQLIQQAPVPFPISPFVSGFPGSATMTLTSTLPGLGFTDVVSSGITKVATQANGGTRSQFVIRNCLNIVPQPYPLS